MFGHMLVDHNARPFADHSEKQRALRTASLRIIKPKYDNRLIFLLKRSSSRDTVVGVRRISKVRSVGGRHTDG